MPKKDKLLVNNPDDRYLEEVKLPELTDNASRIRDLLIMRQLDVPQIEIGDPLMEINLRFYQYVKQLPMYTFDGLLSQSLQDFRKFFYVLQAKDFDKSKPVAQSQDGNTFIYINPAIKRSDFDSGLIMIFVTELPKEE